MQQLLLRPSETVRRPRNTGGDTPRFFTWIDAYDDNNVGELCMLFTHGSAKTCRMFPRHHRLPILAYKNLTNLDHCNSLLFDKYYIYIVYNSFPFPTVKEFAKSVNN